MTSKRNQIIEFKTIRESHWIRIYHNITNRKKEYRTKCVKCKSKPDTRRLEVTVMPTAEEVGIKNFDPSKYFPFQATLDIYWCPKCRTIYSTFLKTRKF